ncbi:hypothetical protein BGV40_13560 [Methanosarcina sp. Ant1]|nr:hypothetical protein BGV40_13560 [Methanosarcina sp. Ant1]
MLQVISVLHQLDQKIIYPHYDFKHLTEKYFEIGMKLNDFSIQLVKYWIYNKGLYNQMRLYCIYFDSEVNNLHG